VRFYERINFFRHYWFAVNESLFSELQRNGAYRNDDVQTFAFSAGLLLARLTNHRCSTNGGARNDMLR